MLPRTILILMLFAVAGPAIAATSAAPIQPGETEAWVKVDVPFVPTPPPVIDAMLKVAAVGPGDVLYDLGSGDGRTPIVAARDFGVKKAIGIELNPNRIKDANVAAQTTGVTDRVTFIEGDIFKVDFSDATFVTMYLFDQVNLRLRPRILNELKAGTRIVSHQFHMFDWPPDDKVMVQGKVPVYFWVVPAKVAGTWKGTVGLESLSLDLTQKFQMVSGAVRLGAMKATISTAKLTGAALTFDATVKHDGADEPLHFEGQLTADALTGALVIGGAAKTITLQR